MNDTDVGRAFEAWYSVTFDTECTWDEQRNAYVDVGCHYAWKGYQAATKRLITAHAKHGELVTGQPHERIVKVDCGDYCQWQAEPQACSQTQSSDLHLYEEIAEHYAKCAVSPEGLRDWVVERMDLTSTVLSMSTVADRRQFDDTIQVQLVTNNFDLALKQHETNCCMFVRGSQTLDDLLRSREKFIKSVQLTQAWI